MCKDCQQCGPGGKHKEELQMQIFSSAIQHVGLIQNKNLLQELWKKINDARISSAEYTHVFSHKFVFFAFLNSSSFWS